MSRTKINAVSLYSKISDIVEAEFTFSAFYDTKSIPSI